MKLFGVDVSIDWYRIREEKVGDEKRYIPQYRFLFFFWVTFKIPDDPVDTPMVFLDLEKCRKWLSDELDKKVRIKYNLP